MEDIRYLDFDLLVEGAPGSYQARVLSSPGGQASGAFSAPFSALELENFYLKMGRPRQAMRGADTPEMEAAKAVGGRLFEAVFSAQVRACFQDSLNTARGQKKGLRLRLHVNAPDLHDLPWEYLYDARQKQFLSWSVYTPIVRFLEVPRPPEPLAVKPPLRILTMISSPAGCPPLDVEREWKQLQKALGRLERAGLVKLRRVDTATLSALQHYLRQREVHIFHFIGHGRFDPQQHAGQLLFEDENNEGRPLTGQYLGAMLADHNPLRLVVLNACEGARTSNVDPFAGVAQSLVQQGIPAVIAMQFPISDQTAGIFAHEFYTALADGFPVDAAISETRKAIFSQGSDVEWGTPVYFTRAPDGKIFDVAQLLGPKSSAQLSLDMLPEEMKALFQDLQSPTPAEAPVPVVAPPPAAPPTQPTPQPTPPQPAAAPPAGQQRKMVTVLFADVSGYTAMSESMDPEDVAWMMNALWERLDAAIRKHNGWVDKHMGDAVMAIWGVERAREDDAEQALRAALEMQQALGIFRQEKNVELSMRIGVNTGLALLGAVGTAGEFSAIGDAVNTASRLEHAAPVGGILISHDTFRQVRGVFDVQTLEPITVKGKSEPLQVYTVQNARPRAFRMDTRGVPGIETRLVGRDAELKQLQDALLTAVEGGNGGDNANGEMQMVTVVGEAGLGKSRLLREFESWIATGAVQGLLPAQMNYFKGRAFPDNPPYALLNNLFSFRFQIQADDPQPLAQSKLQDGLAEAFGGGENALTKAQFIGHLLGYNFSASPDIRAALNDSKQFYERAAAGLVDYFRSAARLAATIILLEDLHWADQSTLNLLAQLARALTHQRLLIVSLARPALYEEHPYWGESESYHTRIELRPLSKRDSQRLVMEILQKTAGAPEKLRDLLVERSEGNPYYIEELVNMLIEAGAIIPDETRWQIDLARLDAAGVPPTLAGVLQARLDSLPPEERATLQQASIVGREFWESAAVYLDAPQGPTRDMEIAARLETMRRRRLVFRRDPSTFLQTSEYSFKHAILRDVTYASVLKRLRQTYHGLVADWLIGQGGERVDEFLGQIAHHLELSGNAEKAAGYLRRAGEQAAGRYANAEAIGYFSRALALTPAANFAGRFALLLASENIYHLTGQRQEQQRDLEKLADLAQGLQDPRQSCNLLLRQARYARFTDDYLVGAAAARQAASQAAGLGDRDLESQAQRELGSLLTLQGNYKDALRYLEHALSLAQQSGDQWQQGRCIYDLGYIFREQAEHAQALKSFSQAQAIYKEIGNRSGEANCLYMLGTVYAETGNYPASEQAYQQSLALSQTNGLRYMTMLTLASLGSNALDLGDYTTAGACHQQALSTALEINNRLSQAISLDSLGLIYLMQGEPEKAKTFALQAFEIQSAIQDQASQSYTLNHLGCIHTAAGDYPAARQAFEQALALRGELEQPLLDDLAGLARLALAQNELPRAGQLVAEIQAAIAHNGIAGCEYPVWVYLTCGQVLQQTGGLDAAAQALQAGRRLLMERADLIQDPVLRQKFLQDVPFNRLLLAACAT